jgi:hypothetical protein
MRAPPLSTTPTLAPISPPHVRNHLPFRAPPTASVEYRFVVTSTAPPPSGAIGENPDDLLSFSPSYHGDLLSPGAAVLPDDHDYTIHRELVMVL